MKLEEAIKAGQLARTVTNWKSYLNDLDKEGPECLRVQIFGTDIFPSREYIEHIYEILRDYIESEYDSALNELEIF